MSSREDILQSIRRNTQIRYEKPDLAELEKEAITYPDKIGQFREIMVQMGGRAIVAEAGDDVNELIRKQYPEARRIASSLNTITCLGKEQKLTCATFHPDDVEKSGDLDGTDLAIVSGKVGVCENGAVWGYYADGRIVINSACLEYSATSPELYAKVVETLVHEGRHAYQDYNIHIRNVHPRTSEINSWLENEQQGYMPGDMSEIGLRLYRFQPTEIDARQFAEDTMKRFNEKMTI